MNKKVKIGILILIIVIIILIFNLSTRKTTQEKIINYITNIGFIQDSGSSLYAKKISELSLEEYNNKINQNVEANYEILYFNVDSYQLTKDEMSYSNNIHKSFNPTYDYTNNTLEYQYRINLNNTNVIIEGKYNSETQEFICTPLFSYQIDIDSAIDEICNKVKYDVEKFQYEAVTLITNANLIENIKKEI